MVRRGSARLFKRALRMRPMKPRNRTDSTGGRDDDCDRSDTDKTDDGEWRRRAAEKCHHLDVNRGRGPFPARRYKLASYQTCQGIAVVDIRQRTGISVGEATSVWLVYVWPTAVARRGRPLRRWRRRSTCGSRRMIRYWRRSPSRTLSTGYLLSTCAAWSRALPTWLPIASSHRSKRAGARSKSRPRRRRPLPPSS